MGKSKKRKNRTKALYEAAAAAAAKRKRQEHEEEEYSRCSGTALAKEKEPKWLPEPLCNGDKTETDAIDTNPARKPSASDLRTTLRTIRYLLASEDNLDDFLHSKEHKPLRAALHLLVTERLKSYDKGVDYRTKVTHHLSKKRWASALSSLQASRDFRQVPKQGTVQRWVRDIDGCTEPAVKIQLLTLVLSSSGRNITPGSDASNATKQNDDDDNEKDNDHDNDGINKHDPSLALLEAQSEYRKNTRNGNHQPGESSTPTCSEVQVLKGWSIPSQPCAAAQAGFDMAAAQALETRKIDSKIVYRENASERTPPNHYDLLLHATEHDALKPFPDGSTPNHKPKGDHRSVATVRPHPVPFVKGAFVLENVLSPSECLGLVQTASALGYRPDHPTALPKPTGIDSCEWFVNDSIHDIVYDRVREHLPSTLLPVMGTKGNTSADETNNGDDKEMKAPVLCGINRRWRFFRYGQGCVYRPHIDGSWPAGRLSEDGASYERDPTNGTTRSYLTFLVYLNDDFEGGETRFYYVPDQDVYATDDENELSSNARERDENTMAPSLVARGIIPKMGSVLVFPQGNSASLLHEGSAVMSGTKYVVRTDVVYRHG